MHTRSFRRAPLALALLCAVAGVSVTACKPADDGARAAATASPTAPAAVGAAWRLWLV